MRSSAIKLENGQFSNINGEGGGGAGDASGASISPFSKGLVRALHKISKALRVPVHKFEISFALLNREVQSYSPP